MASYRIELSIFPLSYPETERALDALRLAWRQPAYIHRQAYGDIYMLSIRHEAAPSIKEDPCRFAERIAAKLWQAFGRFVRISMDIAEEDQDVRYFSMEESDYRRILPGFRLTQTVHQNK